MDSQPEILEITTGSESSDSIISISRTSASSNSTSASYTTTTINKLLSEIEKLREEKKILEGRIRGYRTLSDLLVDCRKENEQLKAQLYGDQKQVMSLSTSQNKPTVNSPYSLVLMQATEQENVSQADMNILSPKDQISLNKTLNISDKKTTGTPDSHSPGIGPPSSLQETAGRKEDQGVDKYLQWKSPESIPKQESIGPPGNMSQTEIHSFTDLTPSSRDSKVERQRPPASRNSTPELLQLDSDKYDEALYEKVGQHLGMGQTGLTSSMYAAGGSRAESRPTDFPSLSSGLSNGLAQPPSHDSIINPPFMAMTNQSLMGPTLDEPNTGLASEVENIKERLNSGPGNNSQAIAFQMHQIAERISKLEQKEQDQKKLISTLLSENNEMKKQVRMADTCHQAETVALREQNAQLMQQLNIHCCKDKTTIVKSSGSHGDWVHVEKEPYLGVSQASTEKSLVERIRKLEKEKAELQRANINWKSQWDQIECSHKLQLSDLHSKYAFSEKEVSNLKAHLAEQTTKFESQILEMKLHIEEEENLKEEVQHQLHLAERKISELQDQITEIRTQLTDTTRDKQILSTELNIIKAQRNSQEMSRTSGSASIASRAVLEAEISMLKEQVKVFAEDFEHEREDRTTAQAARDAAKKNAETMACQNQSLNSQIRHLQKQIKDRDDTISWTLHQNEVLQRQVSEYKKKLASEWEEKQTLQRMLTLAQQQQQQPVRNPYLTNESQSVYGPPFLSQPPVPPPSVGRSPFSGRQGTSQPVIRSSAAICPEHLPGAWTCSRCTYINYPGRTVCESCGYVRHSRSHSENFGYNSPDIMCGSSEHALLMSRGHDQQHISACDLVVDSDIADWKLAPNK